MRPDEMGELFELDDFARGGYDTECDDTVLLLYFWHRKDISLPEGRQAIMLANGHILSDKRLPYQDIPMVRVAYEQHRGTPFAYSISYDMLAIQKCYDACLTVIASNVNAFGFHTILNPEGSGMSVRTITEGLRELKYNPGMKPEVLNLLSISKDVYELLTICERAMEIISSVNSVARGFPQPSLESGAALALVQQMAIQFNAGLQQSYVMFLERVGTMMVRILKDYSTAERNLKIIGKRKNLYVQSFKGDDISDVDRVIVDIGNPMTNTVAGRQNLAEYLLKAGMRLDPEQLLTVLTTGNIDAMIEDLQSESIQIRTENEDMIEGKPVVANILDHHLRHAMAHKGNLSRDDVRNNPGLIAQHLNHIQEHLNLWQTMDPALMQATGQAQPPAPPPMPAGAPPPMGLEQPQMPGMPSLPEPPQNPMTGEQWNPQTGG